MNRSGWSKEFLTIGIDARNLIARPTGIGRYILELCKVMSQTGHTLQLYFPDQPHALDLLPSDVSVTVSRAHGGILRVVWGLTQLGRMAAKDNVDVLWGPAHRLPSRQFLRSPSVLTIHDLVWHSVPDTMPRLSYHAEKLLMLPSIKVATRVVAVSQATREEVVKLVPSAEQKMRVVYPGLTMLQAPEFNAQQSHVTDVSEYALFVGTLEPRKNLLRILEAYARMPNKIKSRIQLVIAGGQGWRMPDLKAEVERLALNSYVNLAGYVTDAQLSVLYSNARFLVMPSAHEGFGFPIIEAQRFGTPVITSNRSSLPEVAGDGGLLVDPDDVAAICDAMIRLTVDQNLHEDLAKKARKNAFRFDWQKSGQDLVAIFREAALIKKNT